MSLPDSELHQLGCTINAQWAQGPVEISLILSVSEHVKEIPQGKQPGDTEAGQQADGQDPAFGTWPVGKQVRVLACCGRDTGWTRKPVEVPLFVLQKWRR